MLVLLTFLNLNINKTKDRLNKRYLNEAPSIDLIMLMDLKDKYNSLNMFLITSDMLDRETSMFVL